MSAYPYSPFPNGWYQIAWSDAVVASRVLAVRAMGQDLVAWRDADGVARVFDGHCPHLGASLERARIDRGCIECPFHGWRFAADGRAVEVPHARKVPPRARLGVRHAIERDGHVWAWFHDAGAAPDYELPPFAPLASDAWRASLRTNLFVKTNVFELNENLFDTAHFISLHHYEGLPETKFALRGPTASARHVGVVRVLGVTFTMDLESEMYGPGVQTVAARARGTGRCGGLGFDYFIVANKTPIEERLVHERLTLCIRRQRGPLDWVIERAFLTLVRFDACREHRIFETKRFNPRPTLSAADGPLHEFRRWYGQFEPHGMGRVPGLAAAPGG